MRNALIIAGYVLNDSVGIKAYFVDVGVTVSMRLTFQLWDSTTLRHGFCQGLGVVGNVPLPVELEHGMMVVTPDTEESSRVGQDGLNIGEGTHRIVAYHVGNRSSRYVGRMIAGEVGTVGVIVFPIIFVDP
ncbi:hypothetical protein D3C72_1403230 [compost metagenome]